MATVRRPPEPLTSFSTASAADSPDRYFDPAALVPPPPPPPPSKIEIAVVTFDVKFNAMNSGYTAEEAMLQIFAFTGPIRLRERTKTKQQYRCANYDQLPNGIWVGQIELQRTARQSTIFVDKKLGNRFVDDAGGLEVTTSGDRSAYAFNPKANILVYRDRATIPHSRLRTFVRIAAAEYTGPRFDIDIVPHKSTMSLVETIETFSKLTSISAWYRHAQSPGEEFINELVNSMNAEEATESFKAKKGQSLNKQELVGGKSQVSKVIGHISKNGKNGGVTMNGYVGEEFFSVDSNTSVSRIRIETADTPKGIDMTLATVAKRNLGK